MKKMAIKLPPMKYCLGIDVSKDTLALCFSQLDAQQGVSVKGTHIRNNLGGWKAIQTWLGRFHKQVDVPFSIVLEATGVYYEGSAFFFKAQGYTLSVVLPNRSKNYARSLPIKTKTDAVDARVLAQMGLERALPAWPGVSGTLLTLKRLCREQAALQALHTQVSNQLHAHYQRIREKNPKVKMVGLVAVQRKLLVMIYTLYKKNEAYDRHYESKKAAAAAQKSRQEQGLAYTA